MTSYTTYALNTRDFYPGLGEIRIVGPGKTRGYPYPVCKKELSSTAKNRTNLIGKKKGCLKISVFEITKVDFICFFFFFFCMFSSSWYGPFTAKRTCNRISSFYMYHLLVLIIIDI